MVTRLKNLIYYNNGDHFIMYAKSIHYAVHLKLT